MMKVFQEKRIFRAEGPFIATSHSFRNSAFGLPLPSDQGQASSQSSAEPMRPWDEVQGVRHGNNLDGQLNACPCTARTS